jgi:hypothetical protein
MVGMPYRPSNRIPCPGELAALQAGEEQRWSCELCGNVLSQGDEHPAQPFPMDSTTAICADCYLSYEQTNEYEKMNLTNQQIEANLPAYFERAKLELRQIALKYSAVNLIAEPQICITASNGTICIYGWPTGGGKTIEAKAQTMSIAIAKFRDAMGGQAAKMRAEAAELIARAEALEARK